MGVVVKTAKIDPWRFDTARNMALEMIPDDYDICISLDLDEVLLDGWKKELLSIWQDDLTRLHYTYNWLIIDDVPKITFYSDKIHKRKNARWKNPVHEIVTFLEPEVISTTEKIVVNHYPDKTKSRSSYLPLLELAVSEDPQNDRNMHYLGREYMYYGEWNKAIDTLIKHLHLKKATWKDERCASMRFISRCYQHLLRYDEAEMWLLKAIKEAPYLRDGYVELALLYYSLKQYKEVIKYGQKALKITYNPKTYINESFSYDETIYDILSIAYYYENDLPKAIRYVKKAIKINPNDERLKSNLNFYLAQKNTKN